MPSPLAELALNRLRDLIANPQWRNGGKLPPEQELAREIGVSRPVLRQALERLRREGAVESRRGSGNYIRAQPSEGSALFGAPRNLHDIEKCMRFREVIETASAAEAARHCDPVLVGEIEAKVTMMEESRLLGHSAFDIEFAFHHAVAKASKNPYFVQTLESIRTHIEVVFTMTRQIQNAPPNLTSRRVAREHRKILEAIQSGTPEAARESMHAHLGASIERLFGPST